MNDRDSEMHEFTLSSANKYKDGTPIYADPSGITRERELSNQLDELKNVMIELTLRNSFLTKRIDELTKHVDDLSEEYDAVLKTHGDTLEEHLDRICELEHLYEKLISKIELISSYPQHTGDNFCGNCVHCAHITNKSDDVVYICELSHECVDPDDSSCSMFEHPFAHTGKEPRDERPNWMEKIRKDLTTPSEPSVGCADCKHARNGMCVKYNCSLGAICATPECHESYPF